MQCIGNFDYDNQTFHHTTCLVRDWKHDDDTDFSSYSQTSLILQVAKRSTGNREVLLVSTERISGGSTPQNTEPSEPASWRTIRSDDNGEPTSDVSPAQYFKYRTEDDSTPPR